MNDIDQWDFIKDVIWGKCDFDGCLRAQNGECSHCGFHPGELVWSSEEFARAIVARYTTMANGERA